MNEKKETPTGLDPVRGKSCNCLKTCCYYNNSPNSLQTLADIVLVSLKPALRSFLNSQNYQVKPLREFIIAWSEALITETERRERRES